VISDHIRIDIENKLGHRVDKVEDIGIAASEFDFFLGNFRMRFDGSK
jgi:hypothetical protein